MERPPPDVVDTLRRRRRGASSLVLLVGLIVVAVMSSLLRSGWDTVGTVEAARAAGVVYREDLRLFVVWEEPKPVALLPDAQHVAGDRVLFCESSGWFVGPHGEMFDRLGRYADGPASSDMDRVAVRIRDGLVQVRPDKVVRTMGRSTMREEPDGPFCGAVEPLRETRPGFAAAPA
ncbi:MAG TPA: hypothetical protein VGB28_04445 [Actinomycetota bacterium]